MRNIVLISLLLVSVHAFTVTAYPDRLLHKQSDGTTLFIRLCGDEFFNYVTTDDGYLLVEVDGSYHYATMSDTGDVVSWGMQAHDATLRSDDEWTFLSQLSTDFISQQEVAKHRIERFKARRSVSESYAPNGLRGAYPALVILVDFPDQPFVTANPTTQFFNFLNQQGYSDNGATGSVADYFKASTAGLFQPQFDVVGPYTLPKPMAYYGANVSGNDGLPREMIKHACQAADADVDFAKYDVDNNGNVDNVFVIYAGYNEAEGGGVSTIWPHRWNLAPKYPVDGVYVYSYACTSELRGNSGGQMCGIGTFVHEFGHVLGLPDFYTTNGATHHTLGSWDVMDRGSYNNNSNTPPSFSAYERFYLGYLTPKQLSRTQMVVQEPLIESNRAYLVAASGHNLNPTTPSPAQFYLLENRQLVGWDSVALPGHGLLITRINYKATRWNSNAVNNYATDMGVDIIEADQLPENLAGDPFPGDEEIEEFDNFIGTHYKLDDIIEQDSIILYRFLKDGDDDGGVEVGVSEPRLIFETDQLSPSAVQSVVVACIDHDDDLQVTFQHGDYFQMRTEGKEWLSGQMIIPPEEDKEAIVKCLEIRYVPTVPSDDFGDADYLNVSNGEFHAQVNLIGYASAVELPVPVGLTPTEVTSNSFVARWNSVEGATAYYLQIGVAGDSLTTVCVCDTVYYVSDLMASTAYYYKVAATNALNLAYPDYITAFSNRIDVETLQDVASALAGVVCDSEGLRITASEPIYIYNVQGQLWRVVEPNLSTQHIILPRGQVYVLRLGDEYIKVVF